MLEGKLVSGLGEGKKYIGLKVYQEVFEELLGFQPFPGTLNLEVNKAERRKFEKEHDTLEIREVYKDDKRLSNIDVTPCKIQGIDAGLLRLEFTDHPESIAELVAPINLRKELNLEDGDKIVIEEKT